MIIAVEGIDGAGKNTLVNAIKDGLGAETLAFPRYAESIHAQLAREALHGRMGDLVDSAHGMATLFALDRAGAKPLLDTFTNAPDKIIILDRYVASNAAYTAARTGDDAAARWVFELEFERLGLPQPDLQVLVDTDPAEAGQRARRREESDAARVRDRYERDVSLQHDTFAAYERLADTGWAGRWVKVSDAATIMQAVENLR
ncbi:dTMP kinase [Corynebacterium sanguinis]|uniref:Thymidylate kinase n=1 Tax=Corynebacterium sanguinis TaxID=2594913 RepID=A0A6I7R9V5_9CORY|nr:dTMP kinase [Corynebacterium sanguinis]MBA4505038.1 dTMP kinase [Corynebacterium sanguinis]MCT1444933.1 dTMP kinase [Corynebacterium sanguinis]MCT1613802.1 dTMP kinase [Corynebacterium sanguinis]MCT1805302.1 dTMP kinase [Corynebacterium sanguinis]MCT2158871.1 dTMP kinase [Corynebacterium sanguinis]